MAGGFSALLLRSEEIFPLQLHTKVPVANTLPYSTSLSRLMENYKLPADQWDPDWGKTKAPDPQEGLKFSRSQTVLDWIILLEFTQGDSGKFTRLICISVTCPGHKFYWNPWQTQARGNSSQNSFQRADY